MNLFGQYQLKEKMWMKSKGYWLAIGRFRQRWIDDIIHSRWPNIKRITVQCNGNN